MKNYKEFLEKQIEYKKFQLMSNKHNKMVGLFFKTVILSLLILFIYLNIFHGIKTNLFLVFPLGLSYGLIDKNVYSRGKYKSENKKLEQEIEAAEQKIKELEREINLISTDSLTEKSDKDDEVILGIGIYDSIVKDANTFYEKVPSKSIREQKEETNSFKDKPLTLSLAKKRSRNSQNN